MRVIFLDMDGVLNSRRYTTGPNFKPPDWGEDGEGGNLGFGSAQIDPEAVALLNDLVERTGARIVLSSSWRHIWSWQEVAAMLEKRGLKDKEWVIDQTPSAPSDNRGDEVAEWISLGRERREVDPDFDPLTSYVILDDGDDFSTEQQAHFVQTDPRVGLTAADVQRAVGILSQDR